MEELALLDGIAQAELVRKGEVKAIELVDAAIARIEKHNPALNAVVTPMYDLARAAAQQPLPDSPLAGVPFLLKDLMPFYAGVRYTSGSRFLKDYVADIDSELVTRYKKGGLITLGKTNTPEFGMLPTTEPALLGACRNPWNTDRTTGGSSGGSAAAVAAGMVAIGHANDGGGSIRIPASCCGLFGMKPTRARNPLGPVLGDVLGGLVVEHAVTRTVRDSAALLDISAGPDIGDPYWAPPQTRPYLQEVGAEVGKLRIAYSAATVNGSEVHADCIKALEDAVSLLRDLGHEVVEAAPQINGELLNQAFVAIWTSGCAASMDGWSRRLNKRLKKEDFEPLTWALQELGRGVSGADFIMAMTFLQMVTRQIGHFMTKFDVWLTPTLGEPPVPLGTFSSSEDDPLAGFFRAGSFVPFTPICNITGQPAMSVPLYWNDENLPIGTHFIGRFGDEATLFRLAAQLEAARPWAAKRPPIFG